MVIEIKAILDKFYRKTANIDNWVRKLHHKLTVSILVNVNFIFNPTFDEPTTFLSYPRPFWVHQQGTKTAQVTIGGPRRVRDMLKSCWLIYKTFDCDWFGCPASFVPCWQRFHMCPMFCGSCLSDILFHINYI